MILTIDNLDGLGAVDYSAYLDATAPLKIVRALNEPSRCSGALVLGTGIAPGPAMPGPRGRVVVGSDNSTILFTGYLAPDP